MNGRPGPNRPYAWLRRASTLLGIAEPVEATDRPDTAARPPRGGQR